MTNDELQALFSREPASFQWSQSEDGRRTIGTAPGCVLDLWPERIELAALFPPDDTALAARNGVLMTLLLSALRPDWNGAGDWLAVQMRRAARSTQNVMSEISYTRRLEWRYDRIRSVATLKVYTKE